MSLLDSIALAVIYLLVAFLVGLRHQRQLDHARKVVWLLGYFQGIDAERAKSATFRSLDTIEAEKLIRETGGSA